MKKDNSSLLLHFARATILILLLTPVLILIFRAVDNPLWVQCIGYIASTVFAAFNLRSDIKNGKRDALTIVLLIISGLFFLLGLYQAIFGRILIQMN